MYVIRYVHSNTIKGFCIYEVVMSRKSEKEEIMEAPERKVKEDGDYKNEKN